MSSKFYWGLAVAILVCASTVIFYLSSQSPKSLNLAEQLQVFRTEGVPEFRLPMINLKGEPLEGALELKQIHSKIIFINFWASWCAPCIQEIPSLLRLANMYQSGERLTILAVSIEDDVNSLRSFIAPLFESVPANFIILHDAGGAQAKTYGTIKIPETYIIDSEHKLVMKVVDAQDWLGQQFLSFLKTRLGAP